MTTDLGKLSWTWRTPRQRGERLKVDFSINVQRGDCYSKASLPNEVEGQLYQTRKKMIDEAPKLLRGVASIFVNYQYAEGTFALFALKAKALAQFLVSGRRRLDVAAGATQSQRELITAPMLHGIYRLGRTSRSHSAHVQPLGRAALL